MNSIQEKFKKRKQNQILVLTVWFTVMLVMIFMLTSDLIESMPKVVPAFSIVMVSMLIGLTVFTLINWRCPKCNKSPSNDINPKVCEFCGEKLV